MKAVYKLLVPILFLAFFFSDAYSQTALDVFGKNRIQYKNFNWKVITTTNFEVYYYQEGNEQAYFAARHVESDFDRIADLLGYTPYSKTKIFIYNSITDLQQSNVGLNNDITLVGGQTNFVKSRVEIAYTGSAVNFKRELSLGISRMFITEMMFGGSLKDMVQSSYLLSLPEWFVSGAAAYVAEGWGAEMDDFVRDMIVHKNLKRPSTLTGDDAMLVGQSIWNYIAERYGKSNISNILNLTRIIRNEESSIVSTLGVYPYSNFLKEWRNYYTTMNVPIINTYTMPREDMRARKNSRDKYDYNQVKISPNGKLVAYSENYNGRYTVYAKDVKTSKRTTLMAGGYRTINQRFDEQIPLIGWRNNNQVVVIHAKAGEYVVSVYDMTKPFYNRLVNRKFLKSFTQVKDFDVSSDGRTLIMSAVRNGKNDIFLYDIGRGAITTVTEDLYDDLNPHFIGESSNAFVFSSNRISDTLKTDKGSFQTITPNFDLFVYDPSQSTTLLQRIVNTAGNETQPVVNRDNIYFLNDITGINHLYRYQLSNRSVQPVTSFRQSLLSYDIHPSDSSLAYTILDNQRRFVGFSNHSDLSSAKQVIQTKRSELLIDKSELNKNINTGDTKTAPPSETPVQAPPKDQLVLEPGEVDTDNYEFDADTKKQQSKEPTRSIVATVTEGNTKKQALQINGPHEYQQRFTVDNTVTSFIIDPVRNLGITFDVLMNEVLEDHKFKGGLTGFFDLSSSNFYGEYQYIKKRIDFGIRYDKKTYYFNPSENNVTFTQRYNLHKIQFTASYPLSVSSRFSVSPILMLTRFVEAQYSASITPPIATTGYAGIRFEYVFDNTIVNGLNMTEGTRIRVRYDNHRGIADKGTVSNPGARSFDNLSVDIRHYQEVHRDIILATRLAYGRYGGSAPKQYLLGGMDNWAFPTRDARPENDPLTIAQGTDNRDILFNEFATNLRGFPYNKLSGQSFLLLNAELRLPIVRYFYRGPITSNFFKNLQLVGFSDIGTAWTGASPFSRQNSLNTRYIPGTGLEVVVTDFKNPFLIGYGAGARTLLFGYYIKFDVAWGVENFVANPKPSYYLTLGYDF
ncbi:hypothetical protein QNI16_08660 [Cytophagaceae bacterium YF14B1]|uniref:Translocation protein TolB n=1 Tax=Xanthocytophaga flava TaxID=3048013 RepID=A0AAE3QNF5_9BACT|nr:hypothetical protein [Xanthocytophaga flavus]MDJ1480553.1 hypothetical protein [Xanthocytophaga flavus]